MVVTRSTADTPVVTPSRASMDTVKAVEYRLRLLSTMGGSSRRSRVSPGRHRHTMPLPSRISCAMTGTVSLSAATIRSASFSRSKSSIRMTGRPMRRCCRARSRRVAKGWANRGKTGVGTTLDIETLSQKRKWRKTFQG
ncbi:Uncharacterised protein [Bordetella pertussis]|nr:Uncharacterised protein [Bordetella pertussis]